SLPGSNVRLLLVELRSHVAAQHHLVRPAAGRRHRESVHGRGHAPSQRPHRDDFAADGFLRPVQGGARWRRAKQLAGGLVVAEPVGSGHTGVPMDIPDNPFTDELRRLNDAYIFKVNAAAEHDQWDLVQELTDAY